MTSKCIEEKGFWHFSHLPKECVVCWVVNRHGKYLRINIWNFNSYNYSIKIMLTLQTNWRIFGNYLKLLMVYMHTLLWSGSSFYWCVRNRWWIIWLYFDGSFVVSDVVVLVDVYLLVVNVMGFHGVTTLGISVVDGTSLGCCCFRLFFTWKNISF